MTTSDGTAPAPPLSALEHLGTIEPTNGEAALSRLGQEAIRSTLGEAAPGEAV